MADHEHVEFGEIKVTLKNIEDKQDEILSSQKEIFGRIEGKGGLTAEVEVLKAKFLSIPPIRTLILYASIGGGVTTIGIFAVRELLK